jgi:hypothetical protein
MTKKSEKQEKPTIIDLTSYAWNRSIRTSPQYFLVTVLAGKTKGKVMKSVNYLLSLSNKF